LAVVGRSKASGTLPSRDAADAIKIQHYIVGRRRFERSGHWWQPSEVLADLNWRLCCLRKQGQVAISSCRMGSSIQ